MNCRGPFARASALASLLLASACTKDHAPTIDEPRPSPAGATPAPTQPAGDRSDPSDDRARVDATPGPTATTPAADAPRRLLVYLDGKDSCRRLPDAQRLAAGELGPWGVAFAASVQRVRAQDGASPDYLISCFPLIGAPGFVDAYYVRPGDTVAHHEHLAPDAFVTYLRDLLTKASGPTHLAGHSYGGWLAMKVAAGLPDGFKLESLLTIDPISAVNCQPLKGVDEVLRTGAPTSCNEAPADLDATQRAAIAAHAKSWRNAYETANAYLHSSPIAEATENVKVDFAAVGLLAGLQTEDNPHLFVAASDQTWAGFGDGPLQGP
jgi:hypothetical protein